MGKGGQIAIAAGLVLGYLAFGKIVKPVSVDPGRVRRYIDRLLINIVGFRMNGGNIDLMLRISNPNPNPIHIQSMVGQIYLNRQYIGDVAYYSKVVVPSLSDSQLIMAIRVRTAAALQALVSYYAGRIKGAEVVFDGNASINGQILRLRETFRL